ncbi:MAG TPA: uroporphyrinogen-III C-methyltransferase [Thermoanaerobaculia bacterium]|nr:uroporphyrinogen-III C-methyltransferase [Thermoanaerobaculia bacterium]
MGKVYLVGAGPGDPGLLTRKAAELLARADLVAIDALVSPDVAALIPRDTAILYVGKRAGAHSVPQDEINRLLIEEARRGRMVVRLKGGDPFVFGRGGEEAREIMASGIAVEIVPGITSAIAAPAYAGIPVTHRDHATSFTVVTGRESADSRGVQWELLARIEGTLVFLMGFASLEEIVNQLTSHGCPSSTPAAVISKGTTTEQLTITGTLADIVAAVRSRDVETPALLVVGDVVTVRSSINWFETKPLFGRQVIVTRAREQASELKALLEDSGAHVLQFPTIDILPPDSYESLDKVIDALADFQWLIFTSVNGVKSFFERLTEKGSDTRAIGDAMVAAVGSVTADELRARGVVPDLVPEKFQSIALLPLLDPDQRGIRTAIIRAAEGRDELVHELRRRGGEVDVAIAYRTVAADYDIDRLSDLIARDRIDLVSFASASSVEAFFSKLTTEEKARLSSRALFASIGPTTTDALREHARAPDLQASSATIAALHRAIVEHLGRK